MKTLTKLLFAVVLIVLIIVAAAAAPAASAHSPATCFTPSPTMTR